MTDITETSHPVPTLSSHCHYRCVIVESPYAGDIVTNEAYARAAMRDCLARGEAPFASHLLYTQAGVLDDNEPSERMWGIQAGMAWGALAQATVVYDDLGISRGMQYGIDKAQQEGRVVEYRKLPEFMAQLEAPKRKSMRP